jgi:hypothetical protein
VNKNEIENENEKHFKNENGIRTMMIFFSELKLLRTMNDFTSDTDGHSSQLSAVPLKPALKQWKCLTASQRASASPRPASSGAQFEMTKYPIKVRNSTVVVEDAFEFWNLRRPVYPTLAPLADRGSASSASKPSLGLK